VSLCTRASVDGATLEPLHPNSHPDVNVLAQAAKTALSANGPLVMAQASDSQYKFRPQKNRLAAAFCPSAKAGSGYATFFSSDTDRRDLLKREPKALRMGSRPSLRPTSLSKP
jgi:hypothetical protein